MKTKVCKACGQEKPITEYSDKRKKGDHGRAQCKSCHDPMVKERMQRGRFIESAAGSKCANPECSAAFVRNRPYQMYCSPRCTGRGSHITEENKHGGRGSPGYRTLDVWKSMIARCNYKNHKNYSQYGGRGITVCDHWLSFENFLADMGTAPLGLTIDRKNNDGNYEPDNCRWATMAEQARNRRSCVWITFNGKTLIHADWARELGLTATGLRIRLKQGWPLERALTPKRIRGEENKDG